MKALPFRMEMNFDLDGDLIRWLASHGGKSGLAIALFLHTMAAPRLTFGEEVEF